VIFFTGFILGAHAGGHKGHEGRGGSGDHEYGMSHNGEPTEYGEFADGPGDQPDVGYGPGPRQVPPSIVPGPPARP
jgi:hypothetical protein